MKQHIEVVVLLQQDIGFEQDKKVFCLPRNIDENKGVGTHELIKKGAILVTSPDEILEELRIHVKNYENSINQECQDKDKDKNKSNTKGQNNDKFNDRFDENLEYDLESVDNKYIDIYNLIPYYPVSIEYLARKSDLRISEINQKLTMLELQALIKSLPGNNYVRI